MTHLVRDGTSGPTQNRPFDRLPGGSQHPFQVCAAGFAAVQEGPWWILSVNGGHRTRRPVRVPQAADNWSPPERNRQVVCSPTYVSFVTVRHSRPGRRGSWTGG